MDLVLILQYYNLQCAWLIIILRTCIVELSGFSMDSSTIQLNTLYNSILSLIGRHLPRMAPEMARTRVKFSLPYISPKTWLLWQEEVVAMQDARREKVA